MKYLICIWWYGGHNWVEQPPFQGKKWNPKKTWCMRCGRVARE